MCTLGMPDCPSHTRTRLTRPSPLQALSTPPATGGIFNRTVAPEQMFLEASGLGLASSDETRMVLLKNRDRGWAAHYQILRPAAGTAI